MATEPHPASKCTCERCGKSWRSFGTPKVCKFCKNPNWNIPRKPKVTENNATATEAANTVSST